MRQRQRDGLALGGKVRGRLSARSAQSCANQFAADAALAKSCRRASCIPVNWRPLARRPTRPWARQWAKGVTYQRMEGEHQWLGELSVGPNSLARSQFAWPPPPLAGSFPCRRAAELESRVQVRSSLVLSLRTRLPPAHAGASTSGVGSGDSRRRTGERRY